LVFIGVTPALWFAGSIAMYVPRLVIFPKLLLRI
jgi:hypothetical protein